METVNVRDNIYLVCNGCGSRLRLYHHEYNVYAPVDRIDLESFFFMHLITCHPHGCSPNLGGDAGFHLETDGGAGDHSDSSASVATLGASPHTSE